MDGVLCDWEKQLESLGYGNFDEIQKKGGDPLIWKLVYKGGYDFWARMPWMDDGKDLWNYIKSKNPTILSSPPRSGRAIAEKGKLYWVKKHLGSKVPAVFELSKDKYKLSGSGNILIDDSERNIEQWIQAEGIGILHRSAKDTISKLRKMGI